MSVRRRVAPLVPLAAVAFGVAACGKEDDFENKPRPAVPIEVTASVKDRQVTVSPRAVGAGLATFTVANQSADAIRFTLEGPTDDASDQIPSGAVTTFKSALEEGDYEVTAGEDSTARSDLLEVGPPRPTAQNELLLP